MFIDELKSKELMNLDPGVPPAFEPPESFAIEFENVSRHYRLHHEAKLTLQDRVVNLFKKKNSYEDFWALKNINFQLEKGKTLGIIGQNGAGKSTLLKLATRILEPTSGNIRVNGRVSAMLELGTGFHPELTARDNIYLNGAFYGFNKQQMDERYERIVEFSELGKFIDTPVKHFSSGMYMRLGFAVAITVSPDILIIDEVLAVGDAAFGRKCHQAIADLRSQGKSMLFVSHAAGEISRFCDEVIYLRKGEMVARGKPGEVLDEYMMNSMGPSYFITQSGEKSKPDPAKAPATTSTGSVPTRTPLAAIPSVPVGQVSPEEQLLAGSTGSTSVHGMEKYMRVNRGILHREKHELWQFMLPQEKLSDLQRGEVVPQYYLAILNIELEPVTFEMSGYKQSESMLDRAVGAMRQVEIGTFEVAPQRLLMLKLEEGAIRHTSMFKVKASKPIAAELVEYKAIRQLEEENFVAGSASAGDYRYFPFCDIRGDNLCQFKVFNPHDEVTDVSVTLFRDWTTPVYRLKTYRCEANSCLVIDLNQELSGGEGERNHGERFYGSVLLETTLPTVIERYSLQFDSPESR